METAQLLRVRPGLPLKCITVQPIWYYYMEFQEQYRERLLHPDRPDESSQSED
jgi:hypothetical protein